MIYKYRGCSNLTSITCYATKPSGNFVFVEISSDAYLYVPAGIAGAEDDIFAIDGNTAGTAGIAEMLLQTLNGYLQLLPALPAAWSEGSFSGLCIRGGAEVACEWNAGRIVRATLTAKVPGTFAIEVPRHGAYAATIGDVTLQPRDGIWQATLQKGQTVTIK